MMDSIGTTCLGSVSFVDAINNNNNNTLFHPIIITIIHIIHAVDNINSVMICELFILFCY